MPDDMKGFGSFEDEFAQTNSSWSRKSSAENAWAPIDADNSQFEALKNKLSASVEKLTIPPAGLISRLHDEARRLRAHQVAMIEAEIEDAHHRIRMLYGLTQANPEKGFLDRIRERARAGREE
jgi:hypothetical protein